MRPRSSQLRAEVIHPAVRYSKGLNGTMFTVSLEDSARAFSRCVLFRTAVSSRTVFDTYLPLIWVQLGILIGIQVRARLRAMAVGGEIP